MPRSVLILSLGAALMLGMEALGAGRPRFELAAQQKPETMEVKIDNFSFEPATLTVPAGATVSWTNRDDIPHTLVSTHSSRKCSIPTRNTPSLSARRGAIRTSVRSTRR